MNNVLAALAGASSSVVSSAPVTSASLSGNVYSKDGVEMYAKDSFKDMCEAVKVVAKTHLSRDVGLALPKFAALVAEAMHPSRKALCKPQVVSLKIDELEVEALDEDREPLLSVKKGKGGGVFLGASPENKTQFKSYEEIVQNLAKKASKSALFEYEVAKGTDVVIPLVPGAKEDERKVDGITSHLMGAMFKCFDAYALNGAKLNVFDKDNAVRKIVEQVMTQYSSVHGFAPAVEQVVELAASSAVVAAETNPLDKLDDVLETPELSSEGNSEDSASVSDSADEPSAPETV